MGITSHPSSSSALQLYLSCLPLVLHRHPQTALKILLGLVGHESLRLEKENENVLFDEDPLNNYMEEISVLRVSCRAIETLLTSHSEDVKETLARVSEQVQSEATALKAKLEGRMCPSSFSPWDEPNVFIGLCKVFLLSDAVVNGVEQSHYDQKVLKHFKNVTSDIFLNVELLF